MRTQELAEKIAHDLNLHAPGVRDYITREPLLFINDFTTGYGEADVERAAARNYADRHGYFWMPCWLCGRWRGGHENNGGSLMLDEYIGHMVCNDTKCSEEAKLINSMFPRGIRNP